MSLENRIAVFLSYTSGWTSTLKKASVQSLKLSANISIAKPGEHLHWIA